MKTHARVAAVLAVLVTVPAFAAEAPAPTAYPYVNPFDPNWWLAGAATLFKATNATANGANQAIPVPAVPVIPPVAAPGTSAANLPPYPAGDVQYRGYSRMKTPYGTIHVFNAADQGAWTNPFSPYAVPVVPESTALTK